MKTLTNRNREEKVKYKLPRSVQDTIPIRAIWPDGIFLVGKDRYSKTFQFQDINYSVASLEDKKSMFMDYSALLNSLDSGATTKLTIHNRRIKEVNKRTMSTEANINGWQRRQNQHQNFTAMLPIQLEQQRQENKEFMNDLTTRNQRMMLCNVTLVHFADSLETLNQDTEAIRSLSDQLLCQFSTLCFQQLWPDPLRQHTGTL